MLKWLVVFAMVVGVSPAVAQLRLIPQSRIDSVRQSHTVTNAPIALSDEGRLQMGRIAEEDGVWQGRVVWTNHADRPLVITRVASTCGCLKGHYEARPVAKGEHQTITLSYNPKGHPGAVYQRLFVYTSLSTELPTFVVELRGEVVAARQGTANYPYARGPLLLRSDEVRFSAEEREVRIACMNNGRQPMRLRADSLLSPGVTLRTEPETLQAGERGDLVISREVDSPARVLVLRSNDDLLYGRPLRIVISE